MAAVETVLNTIKGIIEAFKKFFDEIIAMFKTPEEGEDATV